MKNNIMVNIATFMDLIDNDKYVSDNFVIITPTIMDRRNK
jgi:hypothetical protein